MSLYSKITSLVDQVIDQLQVPQQIYRAPQYQPPEPRPYPVEYQYMGRCLSSLGEHFRETKVMDINHPTFQSAVICAIKGKDMRYCGGEEEIEFCRQLGLNVIVIGPDPEYYRLVNGIELDDPDLEPYVILYHSYDDLYYPIFTLEKRENYIFHRKSSNILQKLMLEVAEE